MNSNDVKQISSEIAVLKTEVANLKDAVDKLVTRHEFAPVKMIAYGLATAVMSSVIMALIAKVIIT